MNWRRNTNGVKRDIHQRIASKRSCGNTSHRKRQNNCNNTSQYANVAIEKITVFGLFLSLDRTYTRYRRIKIIPMKMRDRSDLYILNQIYAFLYAF